MGQSCQFQVPAESEEKKYEKYEKDDEETEEEEEEEEEEWEEEAEETTKKKSPGRPKGSAEKVKNYKVDPNLASWPSSLTVNPYKSLRVGPDSGSTLSISGSGQVAGRQEEEPWQGQGLSGQKGKNYRVDQKFAS
jgi:hypothetical protein